MPELPILVLGIDPGQSGGLAFLSVRDNSFSVAYPMPETMRDTADVIADYRDKIVIAILEHVHSMPKQGVSSTFKFGKSAGFLEGLLVGMKIPYDLVSPQKWTKRLSLVGGEPGTEKKNLHKARAQQWFPGLKITHATADAILLAEYGRRENVPA